VTDSTRTLVTGATGLIGRHLTEHLLRRGGEVVVLVRPTSRARHEPLLAHWLALANASGARLRIVGGDIETPGLGLDLATPAAQFDHVFHLAALYDLAATEAALARANVEGTQHLLEYLRDGGFRGVLHHVSSIAVAGDLEGTLREDDLDVGQQHPHPYHRTKFHAERLVRASGLRTRIYRPSAVVGDSRTGVIDRADGPYYLFKPILKLRNALPAWFPLLGYLETPLNMVPVDHVAQVIDHVAHQVAGDGQTFHVVDPTPPDFTGTFNLLADAAGAPRIRVNAGKALRKFLPGGAALLGQLGGLKFVRSQILRELGIPPQVHEALGRPVRFDTTNLDRALAGSGLACPPQAQYIEALWDYWLRHLDPDRDPVALARRHLAGKVVMITGASSGIGAALALQCARAGATVALVARREPELTQVAAQVQALGGAASIHVADLADPDACDAVVAAAEAAHGRIDILVNNAGRSIRRPVAQSLERWHDFERVLQINYLGPLRLIRAVLPAMRARRSGHIVNVLTAGVAMASPNFGAYGSSKAALSHITDTMAAELLAEDIHFTSVYPAFVRTPMMDARVFDERTRAMTADTAAAWIIDGIVHRKQRVLEFATRRRWVLNALLPNGVTRLTSAIYQIHAEERPGDGFAADRMLLKRFIKGKLF
jgi:NAD(P)-dependent dehydrogenase (short-subunit alcohol dehydrogenase family)